MINHFNPSSQFVAIGFSVQTFIPRFAASIVCLECKPLGVRRITKSMINFLFFTSLINFSKELNF